MKNSKNTLPWLTFSLGIFVGMFLLGIYSFTIETPGTPEHGHTPINVDKANAMFTRYLENATSQNTPFKGFSVNRDIFHAVESLFKDSSVEACRVYMGADENNNGVRLIVGTNSSKEDLISGGIYMTPASHSDPCPTICDSDSPIIAD